LSGYDPDAAIDRPMTILQADPQMGPALWPEHAARQREANPAVDLRLVDGAPHGIHQFLPSRQRYIEAVEEIIRRAS
jgi:hypothetical protein